MIYWILNLIVSFIQLIQFANDELSFKMDLDNRYMDIYMFYHYFDPKNKFNIDNKKPLLYFNQTTMSATNPFFDDLERIDLPDEKRLNETSDVDPFDYEYDSIGFNYFHSNNPNLTDSFKTNQLKHNLCTDHAFKDFHSLNDLEQSCFFTVLPCTRSDRHSIHSNSFFDDLRVQLDDIEQTAYKIYLQMKSLDIINIVQEKWLGKHGNSYYYLKHVKGLNLSDSYVSLNMNHEQRANKFNGRMQLNQSLYNTFDNISDITFYDSMNKILVRKQTAHANQRYIKIRNKIIDYARKDEKQQLINPDSSDDLQQHQQEQERQKNEEESAHQVSAQLNQEFEIGLNTVNLHNLGQMFKSYVKRIRINSMPVNDHLMSYAILQDKLSKDFYLNLKTRLGKVYLSRLTRIKWAKESRFSFAFSKSSSKIAKFKSIDQWNIIKYETYAPSPKCAVQSEAKASHYTQSQLLNCWNFNERLFYLEIGERELSVKYKELHQNLIELIEPEKRNLNVYDLFRCILFEYFGKIYSNNKSLCISI